MFSWQLVSRIRNLMTFCFYIFSLNSCSSLLICFVMVCPINLFVCLCQLFLFISIFFLWFCCWIFWFHFGVFVCLSWMWLLCCPCTADINANGIDNASTNVTTVEEISHSEGPIDGSLYASVNKRKVETTTTTSTSYVNVNGSTHQLPNGSSHNSSMDSGISSSYGREFHCMSCSFYIYVGKWDFKETYCRKDIDGSLFNVTSNSCRKQNTE